MVEVMGPGDIFPLSQWNLAPCYMAASKTALCSAIQPDSIFLPLVHEALWWGLPCGNQKPTGMHWSLESHAENTNHL